jgi:AGCS family alanine or glycine:cation symporter
MRAMKDFEQQRSAGLEPVFDPDNCGIKGAGLWKEIVKERYQSNKS